jgi:hypothetical protein
MEFAMTTLRKHALLKMIGLSAVSLAALTAGIEGSVSGAK